MNPLLKAVIGSAVRAAMLIVGTYLARHGLTADQAAQLTTTETVETIVGFLLDAGAIGWSIWQKHGGIKQTVAALHLAPGATQAEVKERAAAADIDATDLKAA